MSDKDIQSPGFIIYEHPFNERARLLLRLEMIFEQAIEHKQAVDLYQTQLCLDSLFALLNLTNRYELRAELLRELERIKSILLQLQKNEAASSEKIDQTLKRLTQCTNGLHRLESKHIDGLRNIDFLNAVNNRNYDTGRFLFDLPALQYWLSKPAKQRQNQVKLWLNDFNAIHEAASFLLQIIRESTETEELIAENGVYIKKNDGHSSSHQLLRVFLPEKMDLYPRVSGDNYRFSIRFMKQFHIDKRAKQTTEDVPFSLNACGL